MSTSEHAQGQTTHLIARALAHELANALAGIMGVAQLLERRLEPGTPARAKAEQICAAVARVSSFPARLSALTVAPNGNERSVDLSRLVQDWSSAFKQSVGGSADVTVGSDLQPRWALANPDRLAPALLLLSLLGRRVLPNGGTLGLTTGAKPPDSVVLSLTAQGAGLYAPLPPEGSEEARQDLVSAALRHIAADEGGHLDTRMDGSRVAIELVLPAAGSKPEAHKTS